MTSFSPLLFRRILDPEPLLRSLAAGEDESIGTDQKSMVSRDHRQPSEPGKAVLQPQLLSLPPPAAIGRDQHGPLISCDPAGVPLHPNIIEGFASITRLELPLVSPVLGPYDGPFLTDHP